MQHARVEPGVTPPATGVRVLWESPLTPPTPAQLTPSGTLDLGRAYRIFALGAAGWYPGHREGEAGRQRRPQRRPAAPPLRCTALSRGGEQIQPASRSPRPCRHQPAVADPELTMRSHAARTGELLPHHAASDCRCLNFQERAAWHGCTGTVHWLPRPAVTCPALRSAAASCCRHCGLGPDR